MQGSDIAWCYAVRQQTYLLIAFCINPLDPNFSLTFSRKTEYIFLSYVSIEELFRK